MRVVADTNVVVSGLLWKGSPFRVLQAAESGAIRLFSSIPLLDELEGVLRREKFASKIREAGVDVRILIGTYRAAVLMVEPADHEPVVSLDPDDDSVLACALTSGAEAIVSGDPHLLALKEFRGIPIMTPAALLERISMKRDPDSADA